MCDNEKINLDDVLLFIKHFYKITLLFGFLGFFLAAIYLASTPKLYEATEVIIMAKVGSTNPLALSGVVIEAPEALMFNLAIQSSLTGDQGGACGRNVGFEAKSATSTQAKFSIPKEGDGSIQIQILANSPAAAQSCADDYFGAIKNLQDQQVDRYLKKIRKQVDRDSARLTELQKTLMQAHKDRDGFWIAGYLASREEIKFLMDKISSYESILEPLHNEPAHLLSPVKLSRSPISPNIRKILASGLVGGLLFGFLISLVWSMLARSK